MDYFVGHCSIKIRLNLIKIFITCITGIDFYRLLMVSISIFLLLQHHPKPNQELLEVECM